MKITFKTDSMEIINKIIETIKDGGDFTIDVDGEELSLENPEKIRIIKEYDK